MEINSVVLTGGICREPEVRTFGETAVCTLRLAHTSRVKKNGEWQDKKNYFDVTVFGAQGQACAQLAVGSQVVVDGELSYREWEKDGQKRSAVDIKAQRVKFGQKGATAAPTPQPQDEDDIPF